MQVRLPCAIGTSAGTVAGPCLGEAISNAPQLRAEMPDSTTPSVDVSLPDEYMKIAQLRFSASQGNSGAGAELMTSIKKHGV